MTKFHFKTGPLALVAICVLALVAVAAGGAQAQQSGQRTVTGERYEPTIWIDPDGCEHWVMDDGAEGYMSPVTRRDGTPVCHRGKVCGIMPTDQLFPTDRYTISRAGKTRLRDFFQRANARAFLVHGHTDSRASDEYNMRLSQRRAQAVAQVAQSVGAKVIDVRGFGERMPRATNATREGMAQNRRVEITCLR